MADIEALIRRAAKRYGIDQRIFRAQLVQESGLRTNATSGAGAQGIAQFMPATARAYGVNAADANPSDDIDGAARYMRDNLKRTGGDYKAALSIYNSGKPDAYKDPNFSGGQTYNYVKTIIGNAGGSGGGSHASSPTTTGPSTVSTHTVPGKNYQGERNQAVMTWAANRGMPGSTLQLAQRLQAIPQDTADQTVTTNSGTPSAPDAASKGKGPLRELFWQGAGGVDVKNGAKVPQGFVSGHQDHVHVASGPKTVVELGKLAQGMGLNVGENSHFNGGKRVTSGHAANSYHYKDQAIDVSGDPKTMQHFAAVVAHMYGLKVNR